MKFLFLVCLLLNYDSNLSVLRGLYLEAPEDKTKANQLLAVAEKNSYLGAVYNGYKGVAKMIMAKHVFNPFNKWNLFNEGKDVLESAIISDPYSLELRYLRLTIQMNVPSFLGYNKNINQDKEFLNKYINSIKDKELQSLIENYMAHKN